MGPVDGIAPQPGSAADAERPFAATDSGARAAPRQRRLYRLTNDGMLGGVCAGVAAYFGADVVWVRLAYVLIAIFTSGLWILVWLVQLFITPKAITPEDIAAAHGDPLSAREVVERAKKGGRAAAESIRDVANNLNDALHRG
jgi:phage shock protein PspC (stress-responsive transcriptional regulator)